MHLQASDFHHYPIAYVSVRYYEFCSWWTAANVLLPLKGEKKNNTIDRVWEGLIKKRQIPRAPYLSLILLQTDQETKMKISVYVIKQFYYLDKDINHDEDFDFMFTKSSKDFML